MSNPRVSFKRKFYITISGISRRHPDDNKTFMETIIEGIFDGVITAMRLQYPQLKIKMYEES